MKRLLITTALALCLGAATAEAQQYWQILNQPELTCLTAPDPGWNYPDIITHCHIAPEKIPAAMDAIMNGDRDRYLWVGAHCEPVLAVPRNHYRCTEGDVTREYR